MQKAFNENLKWPTRFMELAETVASWSKDPRTQTGACIIDRHRTVLGLGFNGFPRGVKDTEERYKDPATKYAMIVHCEANAILNAQGRVLHGSEIYTTKFPCTGCAKLIIQAGISSVITRPMDPNSASDQRWISEARIARQMFHEAEIGVFALLEGSLFVIPMEVMPMVLGPQP